MSRFLLVSIVGVLAAQANAALTITAVEEDGNVVISSPGGSLDLTGLIFAVDNFGVNNGINPSVGVVLMGSPGAQLAADYRGVAGPDTFGPGGRAATSVASGDRYGLSFADPDGPVLIVPNGYSSDGPLSASSLTYVGHTFATLGITPGSYEWSWEADSITLNVEEEILSPEEGLADLANLVMEINIGTGISNALDSKIDAALGALDDLNNNNDVAAINSIYSFCNSVEAQRDKQISDEDANSLIEAANEVIALIDENAMLCN